MATKQGSTAKKKSAPAFTAEELAAMKEHAAEVKKANARGGKATKADGTRDVLDKIAELDGADLRIARRLHALITAAAPDLVPRTWYGMPAYTRDGKNVCFFQPAAKFKNRYTTLGFEGAANLDDGGMWATSFAIVELTPEIEARITALVKQAAS
ncbi:iron chaperone [Nocardia sp. NPDC059764]|uniref:iron chaperone n=1 Tax=Nocardia sp. NPDC059764 TaxID=3346939 RepID=UPI00364C5544